MPVLIDDQTCYGMAEVCRTVGISRSTLFRWLRERIVSDVEYRDWRGWRHFTPTQMDIARARTSHVVAVTRRS